MGQSLKLLLAGEHEVQCTDSAQEALQLLSGGPWDLVLCDVNMPMISGVDLCEQIAQRSQELARRFVFMTGGMVDRRAQERIEQRGARVLYKPFQPEELRRLITDG